MAATFRVVLDACVMLPQNLNNLLLTLADQDLFAPVWSAELLAEVRRNLIGPAFGLTDAQADHRIAEMSRAFPHAADHCLGYSSLIGAMTNHPKDRHVLAAAVASGSGVIVTANVKDFPADACEPHGVVAVHPDDFLLDQLDLDAAQVVAAMVALTQRNQHPPRTPAQLAGALRTLTPNFAAAVHLLVQPVAALEIVDDAEIDQFAGLSAEDHLHDPVATARLWWACLLRRDEYPYAVGNLSVSAESWDFDAAAQALDGYALATGVHKHAGRTDIVYLKFVPDTGHSMRAFGDFVIDDYRILVVQQGIDGTWRVRDLTAGLPDGAQPWARPPD